MIDTREVSDLNLGAHLNLNESDSCSNKVLVVDDCPFNIVAIQS